MRNSPDLDCCLRQQMSAFLLQEVWVGASGDQRGLIAGISSAARLYARVLSGMERRMSIATTVRPTERRILIELLNDPGLTDGEIVRVLGLHKSQTSRTLAQLTENQLVEGRPSTHHKKQRLRYLTVAGSKLADEVQEVERQAILDEYEKLSLEERALIDEASGLNRPGVLRVSIEQITVRPFRREDWPWIFSQLAKTAYNRRPECFADIAHALSEFNQQALQFELGWVAEDTGRGIGVCLANITRSGMQAKIVYCCVDQFARGAGIGSKLVARCVDRARTHTLTSISAMAYHPSSLSRVLHENGFHIDVSRRGTDPASGHELFIRTLAI